MASWYDCFWKSYTDATLKRPLDEVLRHVHNIRNGSRFTLLDVACGTGSFFRRLLDILCNRFASNSDEDTLQLQLTGIEPSKEMLEQAHQKFNYGEEDTATTIVLKQSPAEQLPLDDESQDMVVSTNAFHFFKDKDRSLQEMKRVLKQNGTIIITDWCNDYWIVKLYHLLERIRWNTWRFKDKYPGPLSSSMLINHFNTAGFCDIEHSMYRVRIFSIFFWGMQTIKATKSDQTMRECEVCNGVSFEDYDDALAHEKECTGR